MVDDLLPVPAPSPNAFAPQAENYLAPPDFKFAATQRQTDFAQLIASGADMGEALLHSSLISSQEANTLERSHLYALATKQLRLPAVQERVDYYRILHQRSMSVTRERIEQELAALAFSDFALAFDPVGLPHTNPHDIPRALRAAIKEWSNDSLKGVKMKFHDKTNALKMLGELQGYFAEADRAKAPRVEINLSGHATSSFSPDEPLFTGESSTIDITLASTSVSRCLE